MNQNKKLVHKLLIRPDLKSKSKRYYLFKPKDIIVSEPYDLSLYITNIGDTKFPGGKIEYFTIQHPYSNKQDIVLEIDVPSIDKKNSFLSKTVNCIGVTGGLAWIEAKIKSNDNNEIEYQQFDRGTDKYTTIGTKNWHDYFHVTPRQEIHQRFTNYLLLGLTGLTVFLFILNLIILLR